MTALGFIFGPEAGSETPVSNNIHPILDEVS
jgi:hypothetical protein